MGQTTLLEDEFIPLPLDELNWHWADNGAPIFYGEVGDIMQHIEAHGFSIYYVVGTLSEQIKNEKNVLTTVKRSAIFKVVSTLVGKTIEETTDLTLDEIKVGAWFALPKIPFSLVRKMDTFFRYVDELHGTESIVLLTYDTTKTGSEGWGCLIPDQENTSMDCDYEPASIAGEKPEHVMIVGSAHSHPGMSAYASPTDHKDQATFDGLHITYGWMKSKNGGATEFHIELQMQGKSYEYKPDQIFGDAPIEQPDDEVKTVWATKVKKKSYSTSTSTGSTGTGGYSNPNRFPGAVSTPQSFSGQQHSGWNGNKIKLPAGAPSPTDHTLVAVLKSSDEVECPFCTTRLIELDLDKRRCLACRMFLALPGETLDDVLTHRELNNIHSSEIDPSQKPFKPIVMWDRALPGTGTFTEVYSPSKETVESLGK